MNKTPKAPGYHNVNFYRVTAVEVDDDLEPDDVRIEVDRRNAIVFEYRLDGAVKQTFYDQDGQVAKTKEFLANSGPSDSVKIVSRESTRWRMTIPLVAVAVGIATALGLRCVARKASRRAERRR